MESLRMSRKVESKIRVLIIEPSQEPREEMIENTLEAMQEIVGGYIEHVEWLQDNTVDLFVNEDGISEHLPPNQALYNENGECYSILFGNMFVCGYDNNGNSISLTDEQLNIAKEYFSPKMYIKANEETILEFNLRNREVHNIKFI